MKFIKTHNKLIIVLLAILVIIALVPVVRSFSLEDILNYKPKSLVLAALIMVGIYCAKSIVMIIPTYALYIIGGIMFPPVLAVLLAYIGLTCELSLGFLFGRWLGKEKVLHIAQRNKKAGKIVGYIENNSQFICFATRLLPVPYPVDLGSMVFGASGMGFGSHLVFSLLGVSAVMIPLTLVGDAINNPLSAQFLVPLGISVFLSIILFVAYKQWDKRLLSRKKASQKLTKTDENSIEPQDEPKA